ncbi:hypothetical protein DE146DRAFT_361074 [Phaeosphaeria sp. MPI-PUGE-AT-0046c]|nr:hypothetical protein DE146DRAFT_361074 [Phaeosphaeria sp. MPI-PUGE-AT-0046c]
MEFEELIKICYGYTVNGIKNIVSMANKPFRFIYTSGVTVERDQTKILPFLHDYRLMRVKLLEFSFSWSSIDHDYQGRVENALVDLAKQNAPALEVAITKPGGIEGPGYPKNAALTSVWVQFGPTLWVYVSELVAVMIELALRGVSEDTLWGDEIYNIGSKMLEPEDYAFGDGL